MKKKEVIHCTHLLILYHYKRYIDRTKPRHKCKVCLYYLLLVGKYIFVQNSERHYHYQKVLKLVKTKDYTIKQVLCFVINTFLWKLENKVIDKRQTVSFGEKLRHTHNFIHANNLYTCTIVKQKMWQRKFF